MSGSEFLTLFVTGAAVQGMRGFGGASPMPELPESRQQQSGAAQRPAALPKLASPGQPAAQQRQGAQQQAAAPAAPKLSSPGQAMRAARQRKRKVEPEVVDERQQRLQKRMVRAPLNPDPLDEILCPRTRALVCLPASRAHLSCIRRVCSVGQRAFCMPASTCSACVLCTSKGPALPAGCIDVHGLAVLHGPCKHFPK